MLNERDASQMWRQLFRGQTITSQMLAKAESVVDELPPESPLRLRLAVELGEIRSLHQQQRPKKKC